MAAYSASWTVSLAMVCSLDVHGESASLRCSSQRRPPIDRDACRGHPAANRDAAGIRITAHRFSDGRWWLQLLVEMASLGLIRGAAAAGRRCAALPGASGELPPLDVLGCPDSAWAGGPVRLLAGQDAV
jgi:hypothetical protein